MRKLLSIAAAMALITVMLSSGALAQGSKGQNGGTGAGRGQEQSNRQNAPGHNRDEQNQDQDRETERNDAKKPSAQDKKAQDRKNFHQGADGSGAEGAEDSDTNSGNEDNGTDPEEQDKPAGPGHKRHQPKGRWMNIQAATDAIGKLTDANTATQLNTLLTAYRNAADEMTAKTALTALLDALANAGIQVDSEDNGGDLHNQPFARRNIEVLREKVLMHAGNSNGTLLALLRAYENAWRFKEHQEDAGDSDSGTDTDTGSETTEDSEAGQADGGAETGDGSGMDEAINQLNAALDSAG